MQERLRKELALVNLEIAKLSYAQKQGEAYEKLRERANELYEQIMFLKYDKIASDGEIDIYENKEEYSVKRYLITPCDEKKTIGYVKVAYGVSAIPRYGNIGYRIKEEHRGNNYAYKAIELLTEKMIEEGLEKPTIAVFSSDLPSLSMVEKLGGEIIHKAANRFDWNMYQIDLSKKLDQKVLRK